MKNNSKTFQNVGLKPDTHKLLKKVQATLYKLNRDRVSYDTIVWVALQQEQKRLEKMIERRKNEKSR